MKANPRHKFSWIPIWNTIKTTLNKVILSPFLILFLSLPIFLLIYLGYFIFAYDVVLPDVTGINPTDYSALQTAFRFATNSQNYHDLYLTMLIISGTILLIGIVLASLKKMTATKALVLVISLGVLMRMGYGFYTDALMTRQHDVWSIRGYGHWGIIMHYFETGEIKPPYLVGGEINMGYSYQLYHPKFFHITMAEFMHFNRLFMGDNPWVLYQANRILLIFTSIMTMLIGERILHETNIKGYAKVVGISLIAFHPMFYRLSAMTNNDNFAIFFMFLAILFAIKWFKKASIFRTIVLALAIGLSMASKLSGALIAIPIGVLMVIRLVIEVRHTILSKTWKPLFKLTGVLLLFAIIVFPIGLYWPIYNAQQYHIAFTYVWPVGNPALTIINQDQVARFLSFPLQELTKNIFMILSSSSPIGQDYNIYTSLLKSSMFGEFTFGNPAYASLLLFGNTMIFFVFVTALMIGIIRLVIGKKVKEVTNTWFMLGLTATLFLSYIYFNVDAPMSCTMDFRYIVPILIPGSYFLSKLFSFFSEKHSQGSKPFGWSLLLLFVMSFWAISSMLFYLNIIA